LEQSIKAPRAAIHVFDQSARVVAVAQKEHEQIFPKPAGWSTSTGNPAPYEEVMAEALEQRALRASDLAAIGITNQRETTVLWERKTASPLPMRLFGRTRGLRRRRSFRRQGGQDRFRPETGLPLSTYFSGLKLRWLLENVPGARERAAGGELLFGNIDTFSSGT